MSTPSFCLSQRSQQYQNSKKIIVVGSACSFLIHTAVIVTTWRTSSTPEIADLDPIEFIVVDPSPVPKPTPPPVARRDPKLIPPPPPSQTTVTPSAPSPLEPFSETPPPASVPPSFPPVVSSVAQAITAPSLPQTATPTKQAILPPLPQLVKIPQAFTPIAPSIPPVIAPSILTQPAPVAKSFTPIAPSIQQAVSLQLSVVNPLPRPMAEVPVSLTKTIQSAFRPPTLYPQEFSPIPDAAPTPTSAPPRPPSATPKSLASVPPQEPTFNRSSASPSPRPTSSVMDSLTTHREADLYEIVNNNPVSQGGPPTKPGVTSKPLVRTASESRPQLGSGQTQAERPGSRSSGQNVGPVAVNPVTRNAPPKPKPTPSPPNKPAPLKCVSQCTPSYPSVLQGEEGSAKVLVFINDRGVVTNATLATAHANGEVNRQALLAAKQMQFTVPAQGQGKSVPVVIHFTVAGSDFDRQARDRRQQQEQLRQAARRAEEEKANQERKARLEKERQARQQQLEKERQERLKQLSVESVPSPAAKPFPPPSPPSPVPSPALELAPTVEPKINQEVQVEGLDADLQLDF